MRDLSRKIKRRRFVTLLALGGGALVSSPLTRAASALARAESAAKETRRAPTAAVRREIETQRKSLADQLKAIRSYELPPGSPMAFVFRPLLATRRSKP
jgi:hypothetical protein